MIFVWTSIAVFLGLAFARLADTSETQTRALRDAEVRLNGCGG
jgi:hypothetical protein